MTYDNQRVLATHHLNALLEFKPLPSKPSLQSLKSFLSEVGENIQAFKLLEIPDADEFILFSLAIRCLDPATRRGFEKGNLDSDFPKLDDLVKFIKDECKTLQLTATRSSYMNSNSNSSQSSVRPKFKTSLVVESKPTRPEEGNQSKFNSNKPCPVCRGTHSLYQCYQFRQASNFAKWKLLKGWKGCLNCLNANHKLDNCSSKHSCNICKKRHHTWLHLGDDPRKGVASNCSSPNAVSENKDPHEMKASPVSLASSSKANDVLLGTARATIKDNKGHFQPVRMVLDCGSQYSFITTDCASWLQLKVKPFDLPISGIGQTSLTGNQGVASCLICPLFGTQQLRTNAVVVECITNALPHVELPRQIVENFKHFDLADPTFYQPGHIEFLLGADLYFDIIKDNPIMIQPTFPNLISTVFGHVIAGPFLNRAPPIASKQTLFVTGSDKLSEEMSKFWQIEEIQPKLIQSPSDIYCEQHFMESHSRTPEGKYIIHLPFKDSFPGNLSESKGQALKRFFNLESELTKSPTLRQEYIHFMDDYINLNHMERTSEEGLYFISHHG